MGKKIAISPRRPVTLDKLSTPKSRKNAGKRQLFGKKRSKKSPLEEAIDVLESDEESAESADEDSHESAEEDPDSEMPPEDIQVKDFIRTKLETAEDRRTRFHVGRLANIVDVRKYEVNFLRKQVSVEGMYFAFAQVPDATNVTKSQIVSKLRLNFEKTRKILFSVSQRMKT